MSNQNWYRNALVYFLIIVILAALAFNVFGNRQTILVRDINDVLGDAQAGLVEKIESQSGSDEILVTYKNNPGTQVHSRLEPNGNIVTLLLLAGVLPSRVKVVVAPKSIWGGLINLEVVLPLLLIGGIVWFLMRQAQINNDKNNELVRDVKQAPWKIEQHVSITFDDVGGQSKAKAILKDSVEFLKNANSSNRKIAMIPKATLLVGPPGVGKTLLANALAGEAGVPIISSNSSVFIELFAGVGAARIRQLFSEAKKNSPAVLFLEEIDGIGQKRSLSARGGTTEQYMALSQLFSEIDQLNDGMRLVLVGATNRPELLDDALIRAGRFERQIEIDLPTESERVAILQIQTKRLPISADVSLEELAQRTVGLTGADLKSIIADAETFALERANSSSEEILITKADIDNILRSRKTHPIELQQSETETTLQVPNP